MKNHTIKAMQARIDAKNTFPVGETFSSDPLFKGLPATLQFIAGASMPDGSQLFYANWAGLLLPAMLLKPNQEPSTTEIMAAQVASVKPTLLDIQDATDFYYFADVLKQPLTLKSAAGVSGFCSAETVTLDSYPFAKALKYSIITLSINGKATLAGVLSLRGNATLCVTTIGDTMVIYAFRRIASNATTLKMSDVVKELTQIWVYSVADRCWQPRMIGEL